MRRTVVALLLAVGAALTAQADEVDKRYVQARQLIYLERYEKALELIESTTPTTEGQWIQREELLRDLYTGQKNYAALEALTYAALERIPGRADRTSWLFLLGELNLKADRIDSAEAILNRIWRGDPSDSTIAAVASLYEQHALSDVALTTYVEARKVTGDSTRFALPLAGLYESRRDYERATTEYFRAMARDTVTSRLVENRVLQLVGSSEGCAGIEAALTARAGQAATRLPALRLLSVLYLETGRPDLAWDAAWKVDTLSSQQGLTLSTFVRQASEHAYYSVAREAAHAVLAKYPGSPVRHQVEWELARMAARTGDFEDAARQYQYIAVNSPALRFRNEAAIAYADLNVRELGNTATADSVYRRIIDGPRMMPIYDQAMLGRAYIAETRGRLDSARAILLELAAASPESPVRDELTYRLAEIAYFEGNLNLAREGFDGLPKDFARSLWVNDALRRSLLLTAFSTVAEADMKALARAEFLGRQRRFDSTLVLLAGMRTSAEAPLAPTALFVAAETHLAAGRPDSAVALWDQFATAYPESGDAPLALRNAARTTDYRLQEPREAAARYRKLLEMYPRSHYTEEARERVRILGQF
jgi:tetratricopeptide (TPR) repeat protein